MIKFNYNDNTAASLQWKHDDHSITIAKLMIIKNNASKEIIIT
jgi:hypothetical protein